MLSPRNKSIISDDMWRSLMDYPAVNHDKIKKALHEMAMAGISGVNVSPGSSSSGGAQRGPKTARDKFNDNIKLGEMIASRLRMSGQTLPFDHLYVAEAGEKVVVFVLQGGQNLTIEDDKALFPSDALMTQLRLIMKVP